MIFFKKKKKKPKQKTRRLHIYGRYIIISTLLLIATLLCILSLINTTVIHGEEWRAKADSTFFDTIHTQPIRGEIYASDGSILATNLNYYNIRIDFRASRLKTLDYKNSIDSLADTLAHYYPFRTKAQWLKHLESPLKTKKRENRSRSFLVLKQISASEVERVKKFPYFRRSPNRNRTGLRIERVLVRKYPYGDMARLSIGRVGETKESPIKRGISGLEHALDTLLYGKHGISEKVHLPGGGVAYSPICEPQDGASLTTTIDITMQDLLEHELNEVLANCKAEWGCAMVMEVSTGDIKAISNLERDPDNPKGKYIEAMNRVVQAYEPGSVVKVISMLTALEDGYVNLNQHYPIGRVYSYAGGKPIKDTHSPASLPVSRFIEYSSNIGMTKLIAPRYENNLNGFRERLRELGFFDRFNTGMARERPPYYPTLDYRSGGRVSLSRMIFGYATQIPPLYTCAVYNAIANNGKFVRPRLVKAMHYSDGTDSIIPVSYVRDSICSARNARILREMMHEVVWGEGGTAKGLRNDIVEIAGKTGTAGIALERPRDKNGNLILSSIPFKGGYREGRHNRVTFCGFFPYEKPKYTCIVVVSDPQGPYGAALTGGIVLRNLALKLYSRGMLDNSSDYTEKPSETSLPTLYGSYDDSRSDILKTNLGLKQSDVLPTTRKKEIKDFIVPDVTGLGIREALLRIESAGLEVKFSGTGYVTEMRPPAGTPLQPGTCIDVTLSQN